MFSDQELSRIKLAIVCPMANEKATAARFVEEVLGECRRWRFQSVCFYAIFDNVCKDGTMELLSSIQQQFIELKIVYSPENKNVVDAYKKGYQEALSNGFDWILEIDAGYSHRPDDIPNFFNAMIKSGYDCVFGSRFVSGGRIVDGSLKRFLISFWGTQLTNILLGTRLRDMTSGFQLFKAEVLRWILSKGVLSTGPFFQTEMRVFAHKFKIVEVPIVYKGDTPHVHPKALSDAFKNLRRLFQMRIRKELF